MTDNYNKTLGNSGESIAEKYLLRDGYTILCTNFRTREGEVDLIVEKSQQLVFVEVKTRSFHSIESAAASITFRKQRAISLAAYAYLKQHPEYGKHNTRFDVIIIFYDRNKEEYSVKHFMDAFLPIL